MFPPLKGGPNTGGAVEGPGGPPHTLRGCIEISIYPKSCKPYGDREIYYIGPPPSWLPASVAAFYRGRRSPLLALLGSHVGYHGRK